LVRATKVYSGLGADIVMESFHSLTLLTDSVPFCMTVPCIEAALVPPCPT